MSVAGVVCEYNPFHSGHMSHLIKTRAAEGCGAVVCVMSGHFVQRGEAAVLSKYARAETAIECGADLVLELPIPWAISSAERFALGAASVLASTGVVDRISFGSECGDAERLARCAEAIDAAAELTKRKLLTGVSYPAAREAAVRELIGGDAESLHSPNDLLGVEYIRAIRRLGADIEPVAIKREGAMHDGGASDDTASASHLRAELMAGRDISRYIPDEAAAILQREVSEGRAPVFTERLETAMLSRLRTMTDGEFERLPDGGEGLWIRFMEAARREPTLDSVLMAAKTKRYTMSRLRRMALAAFLGVTKDDAAGRPPYIRVLGFNARGRELLHDMRGAADVPIITKPASAKKLPGGARRLFELETRAADLWALGAPSVERRRGGEEWRSGPVVKN